ncbi:MAG TPA: hypothetical protein VFM94_07730 [Solirubrobacterales bacterium]|nr:hypothetical protein [Solirubrobacterales bacterium]
MQTALVIHQDQLAQAGLIYPEEWRSQDPVGYSTHHGLAEVIQADGDSPPVRHFQKYLATHQDKSVLFSSEFLSDWIADAKCDSVLRTLALAQSLVPVACIWTMRRLDESINSLLLRRALLGSGLAAPGWEDVRQLSASFAAALEGMRRIEDLIERPVVYLRYSPEGSHNSEILREVQLPPRVRRSIESALGRGPRLNAQLTHKEAAALQHHRVISERSGFPVSPFELQRAFFLGEFEFDDDEPYELMDDGIRRALHEEALAAARKAGADEYVRFFENDRIHACAPTTLHPGALSDADLERLVDYLRPRRPEDLDAAIRRGYRPTP